ncbi:hypothetical protein ALICE_174 [Mycobacterium phage Alice]|uniref:Uncharacterized protein n=2 Tax=Bixzunavirus alice TaxID=2006133 RepID=A0A411AZD6_9CAUD|nr:hypothetical protein ALICE_174 [Mycobacterium phage Alice]AEJ94482.1 hypothetical protein ALICE_174 [Mycobacterium phage Alice]QAX93457.1 hypothetical protein SEA_STUBBY_172 [Mycobacterium phage Stubby]
MKCESPDGQRPEDVCRWENCSFVTVPTTLDFGQETR